MAHDLRRTIVTTWDARAAFDYLLDFSSAEEWDYGTLTCTRLSGDGGLGTTYRNVSEFLGRETTLVYEVEELDPGRRFVIVGKNKTVTSRDTITVSPTSGGAEVLYRAEMTFHGPSSLVSGLLALPLKKLGDKTAAQLTRTLDAKAATSA